MAIQDDQLLRGLGYAGMSPTDAQAFLDRWATAGPSAGGGSGLLAVKRYAPAVQQTLLCTSTVLADVDAVNLAVTFTAPASGNVLVRLSAFADNDSGTGPESFWGLREGSTDIPGSIGRIFRAVGDEGFVSYDTYLTGITPGAHTFKWSWAVIGSFSIRTRIIIQDGNPGNWAPALMSVWSA